MKTGSVKISDVRVEHTHNGYRCKALVSIDGEFQKRPFALLVPPSTYGTIEERLGRRFGEAEIQPLFEARIRQYISNGMLDAHPIKDSFVDLALLDYREVDGLI